MSLEDFFRLGVVVELGTHHFDAASIKAFAAKFDPQPFHLDEEAARRSVFGALCASGWHTASGWMKCNVASGMATGPWEGPGPRPEIGPSPGFKNLKWPKPVYAGETVRYTRTMLDHRALASRPGWRVVTMRGEGFDSIGAKVFEVEPGVLVKAD